MKKANIGYPINLKDQFEKKLNKYDKNPNKNQKRKLDIIDDDDRINIQIIKKKSPKSIDDLLVGKLNNFNLFFSDIKSLQDNNWLNDNVIFNFMKTKTKLLGISCIILDSYSASFILKGINLDRTMHLGEEFIKYDFVSSPIHINDNHWCLLFINMKDNIFIYIDPNGVSQEDLDLNFNNWSCYTSKYESLKFNIKNYRKYVKNILIGNSDIKNSKHRCLVCEKSDKNMVLHSFICGHSYHIECDTSSLGLKNYINCPIC